MLLWVGVGHNSVINQVRVLTYMMCFERVSSSLNFSRSPVRPQALGVTRSLVTNWRAAGNQRRWKWILAREWYSIFIVGWVRPTPVIAAEHPRRSETNLVKWIEIAAMDVRILVMWQVMGCGADRKWVWFTQTAVHARCFCCQCAQLPNSTLLTQLFPDPCIVLQLGPSHSHVLSLFPRLFPAVFSAG